MMGALLALILNLFSFAASGQECPVEHHIFLIHGIGGSARTFGSMGEVLERQNACHRVRTFEYETGHPELTTYDFARSFEAYVRGLKSSGELGPEDKLSLIMHSQGGIIGHLWMNQIREHDPETFSQLDAFITLATPHWGADLANFGLSVVLALPNRWEDNLSPFGRRELNEMSFGSATIRALTSVAPLVFSSPGPRPLALAGLLPSSPEAPKEDDGAVPVYSARPDVIRARVAIDLETMDSRIPESVFTKTGHVPFVLVGASHVRLGTPGIASIPQSCLKGRSHPSLPFIINHLEGRTPASSKADLRQYRVTIFVNNSSTQEIHPDEVRLILPFHFPVPLAQRMRRFHAMAHLQEGQAFTFSGSLEGLKKEVVPVKLRIRNKPERTIDVPIEPGYSTILQIDLH